MPLEMDFTWTPFSSAPWAETKLQIGRTADPTQYSGSDFPNHQNAIDVLDISSFSQKTKLVVTHGAGVRNRQLHTWEPKAVCHSRVNEPIISLCLETQLKKSQTNREDWYLSQPWKIHLDASVFHFHPDVSCQGGTVNNVWILTAEADVVIIPPRPFLPWRRCVAWEWLQFLKT